MFFGKNLLTYFKSKALAGRNFLFFLFWVCNSVCRPWAKLVTEPSSEEVGTANFPKSFAVGFHLLTTLFSIVLSAQDKVVQQISQKRHKKLVNSGK